MNVYEQSRETQLPQRDRATNRAESVEILSAAAQLYEKLHLARLALAEWFWRSLNVIRTATVQ